MLGLSIVVATSACMCLLWAITAADAYGKHPDSVTAIYALFFGITLVPFLLFATKFVMTVAANS